MSNNASNNKQIAKNTLYLYFRTLLIMVVTLYTSRVILNVLGVEDFGIQNAVAGVVSMFSFLTQALSASISRFITFELGKNGDNIQRLRTIFSTSLRIQIMLALIIICLGETIGLWFLNSQMNIPPDRIIAANWVWQCCLLTFIINLISVPYNALIIAHEHMNAYAFVSILDAVLKLVICYCIIKSPWDKLSTYSVLLVLVALSIRFLYGLYCKRHFVECSFSKYRDRELTKRMFSFAGFSFLNNSVSIFNHQGISLLVNIFFGVLFNAARGIAAQVEGAVMQLVNNLTVAVNPQITKSYAAGDMSRVYTLICRGSKYSYFLLLFFSLPIFLETPYILELWLKNVPEYAVLFVRLALISGMIKMLGNTGYTACMATGNIKKYSIWITTFGITAFPMTLCAYEYGLPVEYAYYAYIMAYVIVEIVRLILMKEMLGFPPMRFVKEVFVSAVIVTSLSVILPFYVHESIQEGFARLVYVLFASIASTTIVVCLVGLNNSERHYVLKLVNKMIYKK